MYYASVADRYSGHTLGFNNNNVGWECLGIRFETFLGLKK